jgi:phosphatidylglycerol:prolipoprotein diacylglycerol transferase
MHPVLFVIPGIDLPIFSYGVMLGLALVVGWIIVMRLGVADGLPREKLQIGFIWAAVWAMIGSRVLFILTNLDQFTGPEASPIDLINVRKGGLVAYGGFLGGFLGSWVYFRRQRIRLLPWADVVVPTLASGLGIVRNGCLMYGCDYGRPIPADAPGWVQAIGLRFPNWDVKFAELKARLAESGATGLATLHGAPAFEHHVHDGLVPPGAAESALVYPTQLLEVLNGWAAFAILMIARRRTRFRGQIFLLFTMYYGLTRALMEILRGDTGRGGMWALSTSQIVGIATFLAALAAWIVLSRRAASDPLGAMALGPGAAEDAAPAGIAPPPATRARKRRKN